jgi:hypothetical protein
MVGASPTARTSVRTTRRSTTSIRRATVAASVAKIAGSHNFKAGVFWQNSFKPQSSFAANNGDYNFVDNAANPFDYAVWIRERGGWRLQHLQPGLGLRDWQVPLQQRRVVSWQDNWKVSSRLTLDYGMPILLDSAAV